MDGDGEREVGARDAQLPLEAVEPGDAEGLAGEEVEKDQEPDNGLAAVTTLRFWSCGFLVRSVLTMMIMSSFRTSLISAGSIFAEAPE